MPIMPTRTVFMAISGPSCSGKTTLSRLIRDALHPHAFILHEDDLYVKDTDIPVIKTTDGREMQDWDCLEAIDTNALVEMLKHIKSTGQIKHGFDSKEDQNQANHEKLDEDELERGLEKLRKTTSGWQEGKIRIAIVDGFLLFSDQMKQVREFFDIQLLLTTNYETLARRRNGRKGYVTLEGFWEDPVGYVDEVVWPNYVKHHKFLYCQADVEGGLIDEKICKQLGISVMPDEAREDIVKCFTWAIDVLVSYFK